ncbi:MAG: Hpt domain-containing protein, partial [Acidobacteriota bacterium]
MADDLLPLFLSEAVDRLNHLDEILGPVAPDRDSEEWRSARRELHTLKGASRMMGLIEIAEACHHAEDAFEVAGDQGFEELLKLVERVRSMVGSLGGDEVDARDGGRAITSPKVTATESMPDTRVPRALLDRVSDQAVRLSFLGRGVGVMVDELYGMARTAESGVSDQHPEQVLATLALRLRRLALRADRERTRFDRLTERQLRSLLSIQVQPVRPLLSSLGRHAEELGSSLGKTINVQVEATRCRLDRRIMDALKEALLHLVRNAVDHGIEPESERKVLGKSPSGTLALCAETLAERVRLTVSDDGRGVDPRKVLERAVDLGLVTAAIVDDMPDDAVRQLLFKPGFSTRERASAVSGRGIG